MSSSRSFLFLTLLVFATLSMMLNFNLLYGTFHVETSDEEAHLQLNMMRMQLKEMTILLTRQQEQLDSIHKLGNASPIEKLGREEVKQKPCPPPPTCPKCAALQTANADGECKLPPITEPYFCPNNISDNAAWRKKRPNMPYGTGGYDAHGTFNDPKVARIRTWYCDKVQNNLKPWVEPKLKPEDLAVVVISGKNLFYSRTAAVRDTWCGRHPKCLIVADAEEPNMKVLDIKTKYNLTRFGLGRGMPQWMHIYGLKALYETYPDAKWYYLQGCDNYVNIPYVLKMLEPYDPSEKHWISAGGWNETVPSDVEIQWDLWPNFTGKESNKFWWSTGAFAWFFSNSMLKEYVDNLDTYMNTSKIPGSCNCGSRFIGLYLSLLGHHMTVPNFWQRTMYAYAIDSHITNGASYPELAAYHYVHPHRMYAVDQRVIHEKIDRLINANNFDGLMSYVRFIIDSQFEALRNRQAEVHMLAEKAKVDHKAYDLIYPLPPETYGEEYFGEELEEIPFYAHLVTARPAPHECIHDRIEHPKIEIMHQPSFVIKDDGQNVLHKRQATTPQPLRITFDTSLVGSGCATVGQQIQVENQQYSCTQADILTSSDAAVLKDTVLPQISTFFQSVISIWRSEEPIQLRATTCGDWAQINAQTLTNSDLLISVKTDPTVGNVIAYAGACAVDNGGRPILGRMNFGPARLAAFTAAEDGMKEIMATVKHELIHVLGFSSSQFDSFIVQSTGAPRVNVYESLSVNLGSGIGTLATFGIVSDAALAAARRHLNCPTLASVELQEPQLQDQNGNKIPGSHWSPRVFFEDLMNPSTGGVPTKLSWMTLAFLEDMGFYYVDYRKAEFTMYGYGEGCAFATGACSVRADADRCPAQYNQCAFDGVSYGACSNQISAADCPQAHVFQSCLLRNVSETNLYGETTAADGLNTNCMASSLIKKNFVPNTFAYAACYETRCVGYGKRKRDTDEFVNLDKRQAFYNPVTDDVAPAIPATVVLEVRTNDGWLTCPKEGGDVSAPAGGDVIGDFPCPPVGEQCCARPCLNGGVCRRGFCVCPPGYRGYACQAPVAPPQLSAAIDLRLVAYPVWYVVDATNRNSQLLAAADLSNVHGGAGVAFKVNPPGDFKLQLTARATSGWGTATPVFNLVAVDAVNFERVQARAAFSYFRPSSSAEQFGAGTPVTVDAQMSAFQYPEADAPWYLVVLADLGRAPSSARNEFSWTSGSWTGEQVDGPVVTEFVTVKPPAGQVDVSPFLPDLTTEGDSGLGAGAIFGIILLIVVILAVCVFLIFFIRARRQRKVVVVRSDFTIGARASAGATGAGMHSLHASHDHDVEQTAGGNQRQRKASMQYGRNARAGADSSMPGSRLSVNSGRKSPPPQPLGAPPPFSAPPPYSAAPPLNASPRFALPKPVDTDGPPPALPKKPTTPRKAAPPPPKPAAPPASLSSPGASPPAFAPAPALPKKKPPAPPSAASTKRAMPKPPPRTSSTQALPTPPPRTSSSQGGTPARRSGLPLPPVPKKPLPPRPPPQ